MTNAAQNHFNFAICLLVLTFVLPVGKILLQRRLKHERARAAIISDVLFCLAAAISMANMTGLVVKSMEEMKLRETTDDELIIGMTMLAPKWLRLLYFLAILYTTELWVLKAAFLALFWGLFQKLNSRIRYYLYAAIGITIATFITMITTVLAWCHPIQNNWAADPLVYAQCSIFYSPPVLLLGASLNIITDVMIILLPLLVVGQMKLRSFSEKLALCAVFLLGGVSVVFSAMRYSKLRQSISEPASLDGLRTIEVYTALEFTTALVAFCLPALRPYFMRVVHSTKKKWTSYQSSGQLSEGYSRTDDTVGHSVAKKKQRDILDKDASVGAYNVDNTRDPLSRTEAGFGPKTPGKKADHIELTESFPSTERLHTSDGPTWR